MNPALIPAGHVPGVPVAEIFLPGTTPAYGASKQESFGSQDFSAGQLTATSGTVLGPNSAVPEPRTAGLVLFGAALLATISARRQLKQV
ncbi:MAG: PEP-CTERM sorting domain-containing protein [Bryobacteraceae bacterium]